MIFFSIRPSDPTSGNAFDAKRKKGALPNLEKPQISLLQNVELKVKPLVYATTVRSITVRVIFFGGGAKWNRVTRDNIEMAWAPVENSSRGQRGIRDCKPLVRFLERIEGSRNRDSSVFARK